jgi:Flp pilus assembly protein TadG
MAVVGSLFFVLVLTAIDFGRLHVVRQTLNTAAYEAARRGLSPGATAEDVKAVAERELDAVGVRQATIRVAPDEADAAATDITVRIQAPAGANCWFLPADWAMAAECTLQTLRRG